MASKVQLLCFFVLFTVAFAAEKDTDGVTILTPENFKTMVTPYNITLVEWCK